jgi:hypothetical protein
MPDPTPPPTKLKKRRWLQFSLRSMLILTALISAWLAFYYVPAKRADRAIKALQAVGVQVSYDYQHVPGTSEHGYSYQVPPPGLPLVRAIFGAGFFQHADQVILDHKPLKADDVSLVERLPTISDLWLDGCGIGDESMVYLSNLRHLDFLLLRDNQITDLGLPQLENLTALETLDLTNNRITNDGLAYLAKLTNLKALWLDGTDISDDGLKHLAPLKALTLLSVNHTAVTSSGAAKFHAHLPNCRIQPYLSADEEAAIRTSQKAQMQAIQDDYKRTNEYIRKLTGGTVGSK